MDSERERAVDFALNQDQVYVDESVDDLSRQNLPFFRHLPSSQQCISLSPHVLAHGGFRDGAVLMIADKSHDVVAAVAVVVKRETNP